MKVNERISSIRNSVGKLLFFRNWNWNEIYLALIRIAFVWSVVAVAVVFGPKGCTCEDQITDLRLETLGAQGNKQVIAYLKEQQSITICATKRNELIKRLKSMQAIPKKEKLKPD